MRIVAFLLLIASACFAFAVGSAEAQPRTVCTITVNSPDEKETMAARLPKGDYRFVELVEKGRQDWLRSACQRKVQCDVLVVSGHFNAGETFYSDKVGVDDHLQVDEVERAACSDSCPGLFSHLKEVYLFGCESLNPDATKYSSAYGESGRDRMRRIFAGVPQIYGFYSSAPVGPTAAMLLNRYFDGGRGAFATGATNERLLKVFGRNHMTRVAGVRVGEPQYAQRREICQFFDERLDAAHKIAFIHALMRRDMGEARQYFRRIEKVMASLDDAERASPPVQQALAAVAVDEDARTRFIAFAHGADPGERARLIDLGTALGWLDANARQQEQLAVVSDLLRRPRVGALDVDLACRLNADGALDGEAVAVGGAAAAAAAGAGRAAVLACLGDAEARVRTLQALASADERDVEVAQAYLRRRPDVKAEDLRRITRHIAAMPSSPAKVRALEALARLDIRDPQVLGAMAGIYANARTASVQRAVAEVFIRSGDPGLRKPELVSALREHRVKVHDSRGDLVDVLLERLES